MEADDSIRGDSGVVVSFRRVSDGRVRVTLDDVSNEARTTEGPWSHRSFFTHKEYDSGSIDQLQLSEAEFASLGRQVFARLNALQGADAVRDETSSNKSGILLGIFLLSLGVLPQIYWFYVGYENPASAWEEALWWIYLGSLFWVTYFASRRYRLFRSLMRLFERHSPGGKYFPLFGGALFVGMGCWVVFSELLFGP